MKKQILSLLLLASLAATAQEKGYVSLTIGPSIPVGDFADKKIDNDKAGAAKLGYVADLSAGYLLFKNFGLAATLRMQSNKPDNDVFTDAIAQEVPGVNTDVKTGNWNVGSGLVGAYASVALSSKVKFQPKLMAGFASAGSPKIDIDLSNGMGFGWVRQESATAGGFAYLVGLGFQFDIAPRLCLMAQADYFGTKVDFKNVEVLSSDGDVNFTSWEQPIGTVNLSVGVGYRL